MTTVTSLTQADAWASKQGDERLRGEERDVAVGDQDRALEVGRQAVEATLHRPAGPRDLVLVGHEHIRVEVRDVLRDEVAVVADDDDEMVGKCPPRGGHRVLDERPAADGVQHLRGRRDRTRSLACREDDDGGQAGVAHARRLQVCWVPQDGVMLPAGQGVVMSPMTPAPRVLTSPIGGSHHPA